MTTSVLGLQGISGVPQTIVSARSQVRWAVLKGISSAIHPSSSNGAPPTGLLARSAAGAIGRPGGSSPSCLPLVGLHPDQSVDQVRYFPAPGAVPFDDQQRAAGRDLDRSFPAVLVPSRRPVTNRPAVMQGHQDPVNQQVGPAEAGMLPGDVVGVDDSRSGDQPADPGRQRGLAAVAAPVHGQHSRTAGTALVRPPPGHRIDNRAEQLHAPRSGFGLFRG